MSINTDGDMMDILFFSIVVITTFIICELITYHNIKKEHETMKKEEFYVELQSVQGIQPIKVRNSVEKLHLEVLDRSLIAYLAVESMLEKSMNDTEQSDDYNAAIEKCHELMIACKDSIISNPHFDIRSISC